MRLGEFEKMVYEQMIAEYPAMGEEGKTFNSNGREFESVEQVTYYLANKMWDAFDSALDDIEDKEGEEDGSD